MRGVLEQIVAHPQGVDAGDAGRDPALHQAVLDQQRPLQQPDRAQVRAEDARRRRSPRRRRPRRRRARRSRRRPGESLDAMLARLQPMFFDPNVDPIVTNKTPGAGQGHPARPAPTTSTPASRMADLQGLHREVRAELAAGEAATASWSKRSTRSTAATAKQIAEIVKHLEAAIPFATEPMANALRALIQWYRTGDDADRAKYDIAWVQDKASPVDTINGFIEVYLDSARHQGRVGRRWSSTSTRRRPSASSKLADNAQWFEDHMPWDPKYRKPNVQGHRRQRHRRRGRDRRLGPGHAGRHQPAERSGDPRGVRQQVGVAVQRQRGLRQRRRRARCAASSRGRRRKPSAPRSSPTFAGELHHRHARGDRPRVGPAGRQGSRARRRR